MTQHIPDQLSTLLHSKSEVSRFLILVEIAKLQPAVRQQDIADKIGLTSQAVSEYIHDLSGQGLVTANSRGNYEVSRAGVEWMLKNAESIETYARHIRRDVIQPVTIWTAIAHEDLRAGDTVGLFMKNGLLYAEKKSRAATGEVIADAKKENDVGVTSLKGIIEHHEGIIHVCKVPRVQHGGSRKVNTGLLREIATSADLVAAVGLESHVALKAAGVTPSLFFGSREGVIEAAFHGIECVIVIVDEEFSDFLKRLDRQRLRYVIHDVVVP
ncbi:MAG: Crp/Fnr family transcriptional regulator [Methanoregula sp.]|jgi:putative transcriptional regulator